MAEGALITVASKILSIFASKGFEKAYEKASSVLNARDELHKLKLTIRTIQAALLDAERKQNGSYLVKDWVERAKEVLYDADDLFDEVATDDLLRRHVKGSNKLVEKVQVSCSPLNPVVSNNKIANKVKKIRESLLAISEDMKQFHFEPCLEENLISGIRKGQDPGSSVPNTVVGRDNEKKALLEMLLQDPLNDVQVIAIVGIGGMGKTTLTQLVYNHKEVEMSFEKRWFVCISDTTDDAEVYGKIYQFMFGMSKGEILPQNSILQTKIKESIGGKKFLLVLDDVWDDDLIRWQNRMNLLKGSGAEGSKIIVSTRSLAVARAVGASRTQKLGGLSEEDSWVLFERVVQFTQEQKKDSRWTAIGREIIKKCANVPLAINCMAKLLFEKNTIEEWESIRNEELPQLAQSHPLKDDIMPVLKLSYEHLPSNLKHCFAYCSLFPKDHLFGKDELINLWIAQGYVNVINEKQTVESVGHSYFMDLIRRSFFQVELGFGECCKMHDLIHDLAIHVAGKESLMLTASSNEINGRRHVSVGYVVDDSWRLPEPSQSVNRLHSLLFMPPVDSRLILGKQFTNLKSLRALSLSSLQIENVPSSIGELKHLRYLDISDNLFTELPDSITKLVNLCTLDISWCAKLEAWPTNLRNLSNLRHLLNYQCPSLKHLPPGVGELTSLQRLNEVRVCKAMGGHPMSKLDVLSKLKLTEDLSIRFEDGADDWDGVDCWQPPLTLQVLSIDDYKGTIIPRWGNRKTVDPSLPQLSSLTLWGCTRVKCLPPFMYIPNIKHLTLNKLVELEYIEEEVAGSDASFIPDLEDLELIYLPKLKGWSRKGEHHSSVAHPQLPSFQSLSILDITDCPELKFMPVCPHLQHMTLDSLTAKQIQQLQLLPTSDHTSSPSTSTSTSCLETVAIYSFDWLESFPAESLTCLRHLHINNCKKLKKVNVAPPHLNALEYLELRGCPELELWEEKSRGVDWDSIPKLTGLKLDEIPSSVMLPDCLLRRQELGQLQIKKY